MPVETIEVRTAVPLDQGEKEAWARLIERCVEREWTPDQVKGWRVDSLQLRPFVQMGATIGPDPIWDEPDRWDS